MSCFKIHVKNTFLHAGTIKVWEELLIFASYITVFCSALNGIPERIICQKPAVLKVQTSSTV